MPWPTDPESRRRSNTTYSDPEYIRNRAAARRRANGRCEQCHHRHRLQCDHIIPRTQGGTHALDNLWMLCVGLGSCKCHERKTSTEGGGYRAGRPTDPDPRPRTAW